MKKLVEILLRQSVRDLFKYKSFFLLVFVLILADRLIKHYTDSGKTPFEMPSYDTLGIQAATFVFEQLPLLVLDWLMDIRTLLVLVVLFLFKQLISMWPSSDMRRMHREERERFGLVSSLLSIHGKQVLWDAIAVGSIVLVIGAWSLLSFLISLQIWKATVSSASLFLFAGMVSLVAPVAMAGFSFSSKLAVISKGTFAEKLGLFFQLFANPSLFAKSWLFYTARIVLEALFVVIVPVTILWVMDNFFLRITLAGLIATPFYSFLKMVSFKFFLYIYKPYPLVEEEYSLYYRTRAD